MLRNYLKVAIRILTKQKFYSFINIFGLAIGIASCTLIFIYVDYELSYDDYHAERDRVFRVVMDISSESANRLFAPIAPTVAAAMKNDYPQVEEAGRVLRLGDRLVKYKDKTFFEGGFFYADPEIFNILTIPLRQGDVASALVRPNTVVISEALVTKYFNEEDPIGKVLNINSTNFEVTGVLANSPDNTHMEYQSFVSMATFAGQRWMSNWHSTMFHTYIKLAPNVVPDIFEQEIRHIADNYVAEALRGFGSTYTYFLQPISDIHLHSNLPYEIEAPGSSTTLYIFSGVGVLILLIACFNFMNITTARSASRAAEVGMRKVVGAQKFQLIKQFIGESLVVTSLAMFTSFAISHIALPWFNALAGTDFRYAALTQPTVILGLIALALFVGIVAGSYPAFFLSAFKPAAILQSSTRTGTKGAAIRKVLVTGQFAISIILLIGTMTAYRQLSFMKSQYLGFEKEQKLIIPVRGGISIRDNYETLKSEFLNNSAISAASVSSSVPGRGASNYAVKLIGEAEDKNQSMYHLYFDADFLDLYNIEMVAGRPFSKELSTDISDGQRNGAFIISEAAAKAFGWSSPEEAIGKRLGTGNGGHDNEIIGVTRDFHYRGLQTEVEPLVMEYSPRMFGMVTLQVSTENIPETVRFVKSEWDEHYPGNPMEPFFLDSDFDRQYNSEERFSQISMTFTSLGILIACLGLFGLAAFTAEQKTKEIGVRKVLGASVSQIVLLLSMEFTKLVIAGFLIATPLAYYVLDKWLQDFAYRIDLEAAVFVVAGVLTLTVACLTVSYQSIKAALSNPVEALRYE